MKAGVKSICLLGMLFFLLPALTGGSEIQAQAKSNSVVTGKNTTTATISGVVVDQDGEPLVGASVKVKSNSKSAAGTLANASGKFTLRVQRTAQAPTLVVTYVGMARKEVKAVFGKQMTIVLEPDATMLDEVTVIDDGYNRLPRKDMVGAYTTIKADDIMMPAYTSIDQMLQGKVAGMVVANSTDRVGASPNITIRGTSTLLGNTDPLWVVDGVIQSDPLSISASASLTQDLGTIIGNQISWLNPQDIETITVLKDASATAIYGSKASNGVIVITTKKGSAERVSVRYSNNISIRERPTYDNYNFMNSLERIQFSKEAYDAGCRYVNEPVAQKYTYEGLMAMYNKRQIDEEGFAHNMERLETVNTDWLDLLLRNAVSHSHNLSVSGGTNKITYNASFGYSSSAGVEIGNDQNQFTARLNVGVQFSKRFRVNVNMNGSFRENDGYSAGVSPRSYATTTSRAIPAFEENGDLAYYQQPYTYAYNYADTRLLHGYNILNEMANTYSKNKNKTFNVSVNGYLKIFDWLEYQVSGSVAQSSNASEGFAGEKSSYIETKYRGYPYDGEETGSEKFKAAMLPFGGRYETTNSTGTTYSMAHKLSISKTFNEKHRINALAGLELRSNENESNHNTVWGYVPERGEIIVSPTKPADLVPIGTNAPVNWGALNEIYYSNTGGWSSNHMTYNYLSYFGTLAYSFDNRYVFNANFRQDASNRFGQDSNHKFNPTYSFGFSWRVAQEKFIKENLYWLNQLNIRATYGIQGNVVNSVSPELIARYHGIMGGYNEYYVNISSLPNPYLKWESTKTWNFGMDLQFLNMFTAHLEYYGRRSNAIMTQDIAEEYGMRSMQLNGGWITNEGIELTFNFTPIRKRDMAWTVGFNFSRNWNKSDSEDRTVRANKLTKSDYLSGNAQQPLKKGYPLDAFWSYSFAGLDHETGYPTFNLIEHEGDGDPEIDPTTFLVYSGQTQPYFTGGLNTSFRWKGVTISTQFSALLGAKKRLPNPYRNFNNMGKLPDPYYNLTRTLNDRWKQPGDEDRTIIPALYTSVENVYNLSLPDGTMANSRYTMWGQSDAMVANASFLRCSQISLSYQFPQNFCRKFGAQSLQLNAHMNNVFVIASKRWNGFDPELNESTQPHIYSFGLSVGF